MYVMRFIDSSFTCTLFTPAPGTCFTPLSTSINLSNLVPGRAGTGCCARSAAFCCQKSSDTAVETRRLAGDVGGQLWSQFRLAVPRQLLGVSGDRGERGAQFERHLC